MIQRKPLKGQNKDLTVFIDPASISLGVAIFSGSRLLKSVGIVAPKKDSIFARLRTVQRELATVLGMLLGNGYKIKEVHIEQLVRTTHIYTHWSVGVIGTVASLYCDSVDADIPIKSWEKFARWHEERPAWVKTYQRRVETEDELAAICMGKWYLNEKA